MTTLIDLIWEVRHVLCQFSDQHKSGITFAIRFKKAFCYDNPQQRDLYALNIYLFLLINIQRIR
jgi:hypothetical protein